MSAPSMNASYGEYLVVSDDGYNEQSEIFLCNVTVRGKVYQLHGNDPKDATDACWDDEYDPAGAAMYAIVTISVFATAIGFFIGMMSFKKKKYDEWDRQAGMYLGNMYQRRMKEEKQIMSEKAHEFPNLGLLERMSGVQRSNKERRATAPFFNQFDWTPASRKKVLASRYHLPATGNRRPLIYQPKSDALSGCSDDVTSGVEPCTYQRGQNGYVRSDEELPRSTSINLTSIDEDGYDSSDRVQPANNC